jgi:hypothetical protein
VPAPVRSLLRDMRAAAQAGDTRASARDRTRA